jgi:DNA-binding beta-propeller fold protein YncE
MTFRRLASGGALALVYAATTACGTPGTDPGTTTETTAATTAAMAPAFEYDPTWPKTLPNNWLMGEVGAMTSDAKGHIWVLQRPSSTVNLSERFGLQGAGECCFPAPPVMEFDPEGNLIQAWGPIHGSTPRDETGPTGPQPLLGPQVWGPFPDIEWPDHEHGISVDYKDNVWVNDQRAPSALLKFSRDGQFLARMGGEESTSSNDTKNFAGPAGVLVDPDTNELFVADGYRNRRVIVFDAETGVYKRHWGAYGKQPPDGPQGGGPVEGRYDPDVVSQQFATVHCITMSRDRLLYVCDRGNNRIQVFQPDGTFVRETIVTRTGGLGAVHAIGLSSDAEQEFLYVGDGTNKKVWILRRDDLSIVGSFGHGGRGGGQFLIVHTLAVDFEGNIYVGETRNNNRVQKFKFVGMRPADAN